MSQDALKAKQIELEKLFDKNQLMKRIRAEFSNCKQFNFNQFFEDHDIPVAFGIDLLAQMALRKRVDLPTLVGVLQRHCMNGQETANLILECAKLDMVDWSPIMELFIVKMTISQDVQEELDRYQFPLPFIIEPREVRTNSETGMYTSFGSIILKKNHHDDDVCLDHINRVNKMQFKIDHRVVKFVKNEWRNLDKCKEGETRDDFAKRKRAFEKYDRTAHDVIAQVTEESDTFHLGHKYCKRGRTYCQGYHVTYQGNAWNKAVINFANEELVS